MPTKVRYVFLESGLDGEVRDGFLEYRDICDILGGRFESVSMNPSDTSDRFITILFNQDGKSIPLTPNLDWSYDVLMGPLIFTLTNINTGEYESLSDEDIRLVYEFIRKARPVTNFTSDLIRLIQFEKDLGTGTSKECMNMMMEQLAYNYTIKTSAV